MVACCCGLWLAWAAAALAAGTPHLARLAELHAAAGNEHAIIEYVQAQIGGRGVIDNTGSLTASFGEGSPHTLLIAGMDEPGYVVSGIDGEGYLRLKRLAEPSPHYLFDQFFLGQPVRITRWDEVPLAGVVAAPSVHLDAGRQGYGSSKADDLYVDTGVSSRADAEAVGVRILDRVTLEKQVIALRHGKLSAPWISSRAGTALLLDLADRMASRRPSGQVTLAFVSQQFYYHRGLVRVLERVAAEQAVLIRTGGGERPSIAAASGRSSALADQLRTTAEGLGFDFERSSGESLSLGPFGPAEVWRNPDRSALISVGVENAGTPVEVVDPKILGQVGRLLADLVGVGWEDGATPPTRMTSSPVTERAEPSNPGKGPSGLVALIEELVEVPGVSRSEATIRKRIAERVPKWAKERSFVDEKGNLIVRLGKEGSPRSVFVAHMDEIGFRVTRVETDGKLVVESVGGLNADLFAWHPVVVYGDKAPLRGVMLRSGTVDLGAKSAEDVTEAGIETGAAVVVPKAYRRLLGTRATARSFDDRVGCAVLLSVLRSLDPKAFPELSRGETTWVVFAVEEEIGLVGAEFVAQETEAGRAYAVDSFVTSDSPLENRRIANARLGHGFVIRAIDSSGIARQEAVERVAALARGRKIAMQYGVTEGGNDSSTFVRRGAETVALSWPLRYAHTPGEVSDLRDIEALERIVRALVEKELSGAWSR